MASEVVLPDNETVFRLATGGQAGMLRGGIMIRTVEARSEQETCTGEYALVYLAAGEGVYSDAAGEISLRAGHLMQRFPNHPHRLTVPGGQTFCQCYLAVPRPVYDALRVTNAFRRRRSPVLWLGLQQSIVDRYHLLIAEIRQQAEMDLYLLLPRLSQFIVDLLSLPQEEAAMEPVKLVTRACDLLRQDLSHRINLPAVAAELGVSYSQFRKLFREGTGLPPGEYRIRRRVERSQELLCTGASPKSVALQLGYPDVYVFSKQFKQVTGMPPGAFQQSMRV